MKSAKNPLKRNHYWAEMSEDGDTGEHCLTVHLGTRSEGAAKIKAQRLIHCWNTALKNQAKRRTQKDKHGDR